MEFASDRFCEILEITRQEFETNPAVIVDLIHPDDKQEFVIKNEEANTKRIPFKWNGRLVIREEIRWIHLESIPRELPDGAIIWTGILYDTTDEELKEEALKESENKYPDLVDNSPDAIGIYSEGKVVFVNNECVRLMAAKSADELLGKSVVDFIHPDSLLLVKERMQDVATEQNIQPLIEEKFLRLDGTSVDVQVKSMPIMFQNKQAVQLIARDITESKKAEKELSKSQEEFKDLFDNAPVGYHELDSEGRIVKMNQTELNMLGFTEEELIGKYIWEIAHNEIETHQQVLEKLSGHNIPSSSFETTLISKNGLSYFILIQDKILNDKSGKITGIRTTIQDISERKQAELNLQLSEEKFRKTFENSIIGKSLTSLDGKMSVNKAFSQIVGYSEIELSNLKWTEFTHKDDVEFDLKQHDLILTGEKQSSNWEKRYIHKNGNIVWVNISTFLLYDSKGNPMCFITEIYDITERKEAEEALRVNELKFRSVTEQINDLI